MPHPNSPADLYDLAAEAERVEALRGGDLDEWLEALEDVSEILREGNDD